MCNLTLADFSMSGHEILLSHTISIAGVQVTALVWALPEAMHSTDSNEQLHIHPLDPSVLETHKIDCELHRKAIRKKGFFEKLAAPTSIG